MVVCIGPRGSGKTALLRTLCDKEFDPDENLVPTVGVNLFSIQFKNSGKWKTLDVRELGGELCPVWGSYLQNEMNVIFVIDSQNAGQLAQVGVKLCECLAHLEQNVAKWNGLARLCLVYTKTDREDSVAAVTAGIGRIKQLLRLNELVYFSSVIVTEVVFSARTREGAGELLSWIQSTYTSQNELS